MYTVRISWVLVADFFFLGGGGGRGQKKKKKEAYAVRDSLPVSFGVRDRWVPSRLRLGNLLHGVSLLWELGNDFVLRLSSSRVGINHGKRTEFPRVLSMENRYKILLERYGYILRLVYPLGC